MMELKTTSWSSSELSVGKWTQTGAGLGSWSGIPSPDGEGDRLIASSVDLGFRVQGMELPDSSGSAGSGLRGRGGGAYSRYSRGGPGVRLSRRGFAIAPQFFASLRDFVPWEWVSDPPSLPLAGTLSPTSPRMAAGCSPPPSPIISFPLGPGTRNPTGCTRV